MMHLVVFQPSRGLFDPSPQGVINELQSAPVRAYRHYLGNAWIVVTSEDTQTLSDRLTRKMLNKDRLLIISIEQTTRYQGWLSPDAWEWIQERINEGALYA